MTGVLAAWIMELGVVAYRDYKGGRLIGGLPLPADFLATFLIFGSLGLLGAGDNPARRNFAVATAWGFVVATLVQAINPAKPLSVGLPGSQAPGQTPPAGTPATAKQHPTGTGTFQKS